MLSDLDPTANLERAQLAAVRLGRAGAMISNLFVSGKSDKVDIWTEEQRVWKERMDKCGRGHLRDLGQVSADSFMANQVDKLH